MWDEMNEVGGDEYRTAIASIMCCYSELERMYCKTVILHEHIIVLFRTSNRGVLGKRPCKQIQVWCHKDKSWEVKVVSWDAAWPDSDDECDFEKTTDPEHWIKWMQS